MYLEEIVYERVSLKERWPPIGGVVKGKDHTISKLLATVNCRYNICWFP